MKLDYTAWARGQSEKGIPILPALWATVGWKDEQRATWVKSDVFILHCSVGRVVLQAGYPDLSGTVECGAYADEPVKKRSYCTGSRE